MSTKETNFWHICTIKNKRKSYIFCCFFFIFCFHKTLTLVFGVKEFWILNPVSLSVLWIVDYSFLMRMFWRLNLGGRKTKPNQQFWPCFLLWLSLSDRRDNWKLNSFVRYLCCVCACLCPTVPVILLIVVTSCLFSFFFFTVFECSTRQFLSLQWKSDLNSFSFHLLSRFPSSKLNLFLSFLLFSLQNMNI